MKNFLIASMLIIGTISGQTKAFNPIFKSLIVPGLGEYALEKPGRARTFIMIESAMWVSTIGSYIFANIEETKYIAFASEHAQVKVDRKDHQYWVDIGNYQSLTAFNEEHSRWREDDRLYNMDSDDEWNWDSPQHMTKFENMRIKSDKLKLAGQFLIGGIVVNHILSAIDVVYLRNVRLNSQISGLHDSNNQFSGLQFQLLIQL